MIKAILARFHQKHRTISYPKGTPQLPDLFRGYPKIESEACTDCGRCVEACPTGAISCRNGITLDLGKCLFCPECESACPNGAIRFMKDHWLAANRREDLVVDPATERKVVNALERDMLRIFGRSLRLRQVSAGGCNACEADVNVLGTVVFDLGRFGIQFVASPRHADGILVTGPVTENMREALIKAYEAVPSPKIVIASGACAVSGGPFLDSPEVHNGVEGILPVDLYIPGCPPHPLTILDGMLRLLGKL